MPDYSHRSASRKSKAPRSSNHQNPTEELSESNQFIMDQLRSQGLLKPEEGPGSTRKVTQGQPAEKAAEALGVVRPTTGGAKTPPGLLLRFLLRLPGLGLGFGLPHLAPRPLRATKKRRSNRTEGRRRRRGSRRRGKKSCNDSRRTR